MSGSAVHQFCPGCAKYLRALLAALNAPSTPAVPARVSRILTSPDALALCASCRRAIEALARLYRDDDDDV